MLLALTGYEVGLLAVAAVFVVFALFFALVVPRARPDFPARRLGVFIAVCVGLFAAQITAVLLLSEVGEEHGAEAAETQPGGGTGTTPTETTGTETTSTETTATETQPAAGEGDAVAGKEIFTGSAGCSNCHTLADAGASGTIGPNLDQAKPTFELAVERVTNGKSPMPSFKGTLSEQQIKDVAAYVSTAAGG